MDLATARAIIADNSLAPHQADWMLAGKVLYQHYQDNPHLLRRVDGGTLTADAAPRRRKPTKATISKDLSSTVSLMRQALWMLRRKTVDHALTRDADQGQGRKLLKLSSTAAYKILRDPEDGGVWLFEEGGQTGKPPPSADPDLMEADPAKKMGPTEQSYFGDAVARHRAVTAARARGAAFAQAQNEKARARWGG